ncbi:MAG: SUMF1/EgtB/PvdO family nonheme iron enzyme [Treponema sp.]|nr:SUMF1/EgtB/PvdO family nonheme iron enzyme [Treponema sp.]
MVCKHPVTKHEYYRFCKDSGKKTANLKNGNSPACGINWYDAIVYCNLRSIAENLTPVYRINNNTNPAKWNEIESASSEEGTKYCGPSLPIIEWDEVSMNIAADGYRLPTEAEWIHLAHNSDKTACKFADGLWEWCYDWCGSVNGEKDGIELNMGFDRILRTISFDNGSLSQLQTAQHKDYPDSRDRDFGFRVVRTVV